MSEHFDWGLGTWVGFNVAVALLLVLDLGILTRKDHVVSLREATLVTLLWTAIAAGMGVWVFLTANSDKGLEYLTGYVVERALSIDNLFVFLVIFGYFQLPAQYQVRGLFWGIILALLARAIFIAAGVTIINAFAPVLFVLGAFLVYTAYKLAFTHNREMNPEKNLALRLARKVMPVTSKYNGSHFFTVENGVRMATPMLLVVLVLGTTDIVFAVDSIPTILGITTDPFIVWSSNAMAVLGMRPLFFLLAGMVRLFRYLQYGLALILGFVGAKMIFNETIHQFDIDLHINEELETFASLGFVIAVLIVSTLLSKLIPAKAPAPGAHPASPAHAQSAVSAPGGGANGGGTGASKT